MLGFGASYSRDLTVVEKALRFVHTRVIILALQNNCVRSATLIDVSKTLIDTSLPDTNHRKQLFRWNMKNVLVRYHKYISFVRQHYDFKHNGICHELQWLYLKIGQQDDNPNNCHQGYWYALLYLHGHLPVALYATYQNISASRYLLLKIHIKNVCKSFLKSFPDSWYQIYAIMCNYCLR